MSLNVWGGKVHKPLISYIKKQTKDTDIFCFQEVFHSPLNQFSHGAKTNLYSDISKILKNYTGFFAPTFRGYDIEEKVEFELSFGQATFVKKSLNLLSEETFFVYGRFDHTPPLKQEEFKHLLDLPRNMHCVKLKIEGKPVLIGNLHGYWNPDIPASKKDTPERLEQSKKIKKVFEKFKNPKILCGDFNLEPNIKSMKILESGMRNLIKDFGITSTRSKYYRYYDRKERYADYILVSNDIKVNKFEVIENEVSDHLPLVLDFSI